MGRTNKKKKKKNHDPTEKSSRGDVRPLAGTKTKVKGLTIREQLREQGLHVHDIAADGHCLFRSLWDQLDGISKTEDHRHLRSVIMDRVEREKEFFSMFIEDDEPFDEYMVRMRDDGWGGNLEMQACSLSFHCNIRIYQDGMPSWTIQNFSEDCMMLHLSYHDGNHFNSVRDSLTGRPASCRSYPASKTPIIDRPNGGVKTFSIEHDVNFSDPLFSNEAASKVTKEEYRIVVSIVLIVSDCPTVQVSFTFKKCRTSTNKKSKKEKGVGNINEEEKYPSSREACPCGSKKKYKKCCKKRHARSSIQHPAADQDIASLAQDISNIYV